tara:strand:- start:1012 stop:3018 length:2007 start_codon:yes stop_codon:yes gene_type:complete
MQNELMGQVVFASQYAQQKENGRESWEDAVDRVIRMHVKKYPSLEEEIKNKFALVKQKRIVPSQRSMQFGGKAIEERNMRIYNCTYSPADRPRFFSEMFWLLLCGCGTGFSVKREHIKDLPRIIDVETHQKRKTLVHVVQDSIEGWSNALQALLDCYFHTDYFDHSIDYEIHFDYHLIRPKGSLISSGGIAPGPQPLEDCLNEVRHLLVSRLGKRLRSIDVFDLCMCLSAAVLSGGVRRSASICLFDQDDQLMLNAKIGDWYLRYPNRAYANISASIVTDGKEEKRHVKRAVDLNSDWGEPGVFFSNASDFGTNPCCEIGLYPYWVQSPSGESIDKIPLVISRDRERLEFTGWSFRSGWSVCNLTEINMQRNKTFEEFLESCRAASFIGTLQAGYTNTGYLGKVSKAIIEKEALIGVSLTGMYSNFSISFSPKILEAGANAVVEENIRVSKLIGINYASRTTCIKPSGNTSTLLGTSAGIHPFHSRRWIRTIRLSKINPVWKEIKEKLPEVIIDQDGDTGIVQFACEIPDSNSWIREEVNAQYHLEQVNLVQEHWVLPGSINTRIEGLTHNVSNTCSIKHHEWRFVADWLWKIRHNVKGVAMMPDTGDYVYENAPYQTVLDGSYGEVVWKKLRDADWSLVDLTSIEGGNDAHLTGACDGLKCESPLMK